MRMRRPYYQRACYPRFEHADTVIGGGGNASGPPTADEGEGEVNHEIPRGWHSAQTGAKPHSAQTGAKSPLEEEDAITWFHWNTRNTTFFNDTLRGPSSRKPLRVLVCVCFRSRRHQCAMAHSVSAVRALTTLRLKPQPLFELVWYGQF